MTLHMKPETLKSSKPSYAILIAAKREHSPYVLMHMSRIPSIFLVVLVNADEHVENRLLCGGERNTMFNTLSL